MPKKRFWLPPTSTRQGGWLDRTSLEAAICTGLRPARLPPVSRIESNEIASRPVVIECCSSTERLVVTSPFVSVV